MSAASYIIVGLAVLIVFLPARYDPAIRLKEWVQNKRTKGTSDER
jgi:uncharacterized membrane protein YuzA (DUF378 family)